MNGETKTPITGREREIFLEALEQTEAGGRAAFLERACGPNQDLRRRVEDLLREQAQVGNFLETPALVEPRTPATLADPVQADTVRITVITEQPGDFIGPYKLLQKIGEGGCGIVYMAEQEKPVRRRIALKIIKLGMDTKQVIARFDAERQALALMEHPNIARVLDAGATATGRPYFVMELVRGIRMTDYCDQHNLPTDERLKLFIQVCQAIQHAHQKGIIHRDIKPSNILVTSHDGTPVPKVIDFGVAKATNQQRLTDLTLFTAFEQFIGTPAYMSPEQAEMSGLDIDTRSDIYSLGVLLYELLTGKTPFDADQLLRGGLDECRRTIREQEPLWPSTRLATLLDAELTTTAQHRQAEPPKLLSLVRGDLDWIAMKALDKDRTRRYATANALATDLQRYLDNEPVLARPPSNVYRLQKLFRRHRGAFAAAAGIAVTLLAGAAISTWQAVRAFQAERTAQASQRQETFLRKQAEHDRERAIYQGNLARLNEYVADINLAQQSLRDGNYGRAAQLLDKHRPQAGETDLRGFEWRYLWRLSRGDTNIALPVQDGPVQALAISPGGEWLAVGLHEKLNILDLRTRSLVTSLPRAVTSLAFLPDGKTLLTSSRSAVRIWKTGEWTEQKTLELREGPGPPTPGRPWENFGPIALSRDGSRAATQSREGIRVWDTRTWAEVRLLPRASSPMAFSPDGGRLVASGETGLTVWSLADETATTVLADSTNLFVRFGPWLRFDVLTFSPDGNFVVAARNARSERGVFLLSIWDAQTGKETAVMPEDPERIEHTGMISELAFSPDGRTLATASLDHSIRLWDFATRKRSAIYQGHLNEVWCLAFSPNGQWLVSGARDGGLKLWPVTHRQHEEDTVPGPWQPLAFSKDSRRLAAFDPRQGKVAFFNVVTREPEQEIQLEQSGRFRPGSTTTGGRPTPPTRPPFSLSLSHDLGTLAEGLEDGQVKLWDTKTLDFITLKAGDDGIGFAVLSPDGHQLVTGCGFGQGTLWWDLKQHAHTLMESEVHRAIFSPDGATLATFGHGNNLQLWDTATHLLRTNLVVEQTLGRAVAFSPDSRLLATTGGPEDADDAIWLWEVATGRLLGVCKGHKQGVFSVAFSPDGRTLASSSDDSTLKLWNVATQQELLTIRRLGGALSGLLFSPDGSLLAGARGFFSQSGEIRFHRAALLAEIDHQTGQASGR